MDGAIVRRPGAGVKPVLVQRYQGCCAGIHGGDYQLGGLNDTVSCARIRIAPGNLAVDGENGVAIVSNAFTEEAVTSSPPVLDAREGKLPLPRQARSIEARRRLGAAAREVFAERGYDAASVEEITNRAGVAVGAFYLHFRSKRHLLVELMNQLLERLQRVDLTLSPSNDLQAALRQFVLATLRSDQENYGVIRAWMEAAAKDHELARMNDDIHAWTRRRVHGVMRMVSRHDRARRSRDLGFFAELIDRHLWMLLARAPTMSARRFAAEARVTSDIIYHYLIRDPTA